MKSQSFGNAKLVLNGLFLNTLVFTAQYFKRGENTYVCHVSFGATVAAELRTFVHDSLGGLFPVFPEGKLWEFFFCFIHIFSSAASNKDAVAGSGFSTERICHVFTLIRSGHESLCV